MAGPTRSSAFNPRCTDCPRLARFLKETRVKHPDYYARPVPPFGDAKARLLIVGLAPGMHGANRTGRPFTGDYAGILLYETLHKFGLSTQATSVSADDKLRLRNCRISNAVKCVPPANKPLPEEIETCNGYLTHELEQFPKNGVVLALGTIAHNAVLKAFGQRLSAFKFAHAAEHTLPNGATMIDSYHCSRYNTQTRRLTPAMFEKVVGRAKRLVELKGR